MSNSLEALEVADERRFLFPQLKQEIGELSRPKALLLVARLLEEDSSRVGACRVYKLLEALPGVGATKVELWLGAYEIWPLRRVRDLEQRDRRVLARQLTWVAQRAERMVQNA